MTAESITTPVICDASKVIFADTATREELRGELEQLCHPKQAGWEKVKHNVSRTVYRGRAGGHDIYLKQFHSKSLIHRLGRQLGVSDARSEMAFMLHLSDHGVATTVPLAAVCHDGMEWLATEAVVPAVNADQWHEQLLREGHAGRMKIQRAAEQLGELIGRMHAAGVVHRDLHCGNVLVQTDNGDGEAKLVLTDLHRAVRRRWISRRARAANLAQLLHDRVNFTSRTERLRFLKGYLRTANTAGTLRGWQRLIELAAQRHTRRQHAQRDRRIRGKNQYFTPLKLSGGWHGQAVLASKRHMAGSQAAEVVFDADAWRDALADPNALFTDGTVVKDSRSTLVIYRKLTVGEHTVDVYVKRYRRKHPWKILLDCFRDPRAMRAFRMGHALLTRRIATAMPLAALVRRIGPFVTDNILITEAVSAPRLNDFLKTWLSAAPKGNTPMTVAQQRQLAQEVLWQLGRMLQHLHDNKLAHRDLKATNVLVRWSPGISPEVVLIDLDGVRHVHHISQKRRFQGLMRLNVSLLECPVVNHAGRLRMLLGYLRRPGSGRINFKTYWRVLERWSAKKLRQQIRSRRKRQRATRRP